MVTSYGTGQYSGSGATEAHQFGLPSNYLADNTKRLVVWCHSAGGVASEPFLSAATYPLVNAITKLLGLPIISFDGTTPSGGLAQHWGNDTGKSRLTDAINYAHTAINAKIDKVIVLGVSMGGMLASNWARANSSTIKGLGLFYPAVNLQAVHDGTGGAAGGGAASTEAAYGGSLANFNAAVVAHDPAQNASALAALGVPMKMYYSTADTTVGSANQTAFATAVGAALQTQSLGSPAHADMTALPVTDIVDFIRPLA